MNARELKERFAQVRTGDKEAFALIYHDMKIPAYTIIYRIVGKQEAAEDITQELFLKLYTSPPDSSIKNPRAWMFQVARNLALDYLRKRQHGELDIEMSSKATLLDERVSLQCDIEQAMTYLTCEQREIVTLYLTIGLPFKEIADIMGLSLSSTYRRYRKALTILRNKLNGGIL